MLFSKEHILTPLASFFFKRKSTDWIIFFRVSIGLLILTHFIATLPDFDLLYGLNSIIPNDILTVFTPEYAIPFSQLRHWATGIGFSVAFFSVFFKLAYILLALNIILALYPRISALLLLILHVSLMSSAPYFSYGIDYFTSMSLFYLILIPSGRLFKTKKWRNHLNKLNITPYYRLLQIHISLIYFFSGLLKVLGFNWRNGESIWKAIHLPFVNLDFAFNFDTFGQYPWLFILIGWITVITELFYPLFMWWKKSRKFWLFLTVSMHIGIALVLNLYFFSTIMIIWNFTAFYFTPSLALKPKQKLRFILNR